MGDLPNPDDNGDRLIGYLTAAHRPLRAHAEGAAIRPADAVEALRLVGPARAQMDGLERRLIDAARDLGLTWKQIAQALGLDSPQAAHQRSRRLSGAMDNEPTMTPDGTAPTPPRTKAVP